MAMELEQTPRFSASLDFKMSHKVLHRYQLLFKILLLKQKLQHQGEITFPSQETLQHNPNRTFPLHQANILLSHKNQVTVILARQMAPAWSQTLKMKPRALKPKVT